MPDEPGLGVTLDRDELERLKDLSMPTCDPFIVQCRYPGGRTLSFIHDPEEQRNFLFIPDLAVMPRRGCADQVKTSYMDDDGTEEYRIMFHRCKDGPVFE